ncbi:TetR/AcrR family transcriptional regulator [Glycomyces tenuis]|uniref:TetR/AcrR family transcriptional regulator n=1 Tax=Glycomyces tenuis TaxID=58116 RepID=UPI00041FEDB4|nr:TetR/AcrR family transcriptional regulator [Glycomyces tenuis]
MAHRPAKTEPGETDPLETGLGRRRRRISDTETEERMLATAVEMINETGLTVSLEHLRFEDVIRAAGVARSAVYRRWPYKDLFFADLLRELARGTDAAAIGELESKRGMAQAAAEHADLVETPEGRERLGAELIRGARDFETLQHSSAWRTYLALHATFLSLEEGRLRDEVRETLSEAEAGFVRRISDSYRELTGLLGYRIRPGSGVSFEQLAAMASAALRGTALMMPTIPMIEEARVQGAPFGGEVAEWTLPALTAGAVILQFFEPDPDVVWDEDRIERVKRELTAFGS